MSHSWPLLEQPRQFELGHLLNCAVTDALEPLAIGELNLHHTGCWECDLSDNSVAWSGGVYDIFGFPRGVAITRQDALACYHEESRAIMERLRAEAIRLGHGFTVDIQIRPAAGTDRWMRLIGAPVCIGDRVARLHGLKIVL